MHAFHGRCETDLGGEMNPARMEIEGGGDAWKKDAGSKALHLWSHVNVSFCHP
jgi:hypothetical protein